MIGHAKATAARVLHGSGLLSAGFRLAGGGVTILTYHRVFEDPSALARYPYDGMTISADSFRRQVAVLAEEFNVISLRAAARLLASGERVPSRTVVITFDDGFVDNHHCAFPILRDAGLTATFFISTDFIGRNELLWFDQLAYVMREHLDKPGFSEQFAALDIPLAAELAATAATPGQEVNARIKTMCGMMKTLDDKTKVAAVAEMQRYFPHREDPSKDFLMTWEMARAMHRGGMEFGGHGTTHAILTQLPREDAEREIAGSLTAIRDNLGVDEITFCYPNGSFDDEVKEIVQRLGFVCCCSSEIGVRNKSGADLFALQRIGITENLARTPRGAFSEALFVTELSGLFNALLMRNRRRLRTKADANQP
jgi:peptidoglycan/xylan/chitin deacetylase (PgdA/CDA1 family)